MLKTDQEYRNQIKQVGKYNLKDTHKWRERAIYFQEYGNYEPDNIIPDTKDWDDFWDEEERRIMEGLWIDGFYIPGLYYLYLNYLPIYQKQLKKYEFPDVYDSDYHTFLCLEHAIFLKQHFVVIKKRQCIDKDSFIYTPLGVETIESLFNQNYRGDIYSLNTKKELVVDSVEDIWLAKKVNQILKITLTGGKTIECTNKHKINTTQGWKEAKDLKIKDVLYTINPPFGNISIEESEAIVMGYFFADGSYSKKNIAPKFTNTNPDYLNDFEYHFLKWRSDSSIRKHIKGNVYDYVITNKEQSKGKPNPFKRYLFEQGLCNKDAERTIPIKYMNLDKESTALMINRIFAGDGWLSRMYNSHSNSHRYEIGIGSMSLKFLNQLSFLLSKFDINCSIKETSFGKKQKKKFYKLRIYKTTESEKFLSKIGIFKKDTDLNIVKIHNNKENTSQIKKIEILEKETLTYDLKTKNTASFFANGIHVHNSGFTLKFCTPLIREQFFGRGSPNYITTYEEAQVLKTWEVVLEPYREHMNAFTPWYRDFNPSKPLNWRVAKEVIDEYGRKLIKGRKNTLKGLVLSKSASKGVGGCNLKGTPIKMSNGTFKNVEDIKIGDFVVGKDGLPKKVLNLFSGVSEMFEIFQTKGKSYIVTPNHKLHLYDQKNNDCINIEVQDFVKLSNNRQKQLNGIKHKGIVYSNNDRNLPIDPYYLGLFLGDGCQGKYNILVNKTKDPEIFEYIKNLAIKENHDFSCIHRNLIRKEYNDQMYDLKLNSKIRKEGYTYNFEKLGLKRKFIPLEYKQSSIRQRLELLAGLIDSDGYYNHKKARFEISSKYDELFNDIVELCTDLGFTISKSIKINNGKKSTVYNKETIINAIYIKGELWKIPTKVNRKIAPNAKRRNSDGKSKLKVTNWGIGEYYGFECEDHLYILEDGTVTHNSATYIFCDEAGVNPVLSKFIGYVKPMIEYGDSVEGTIIVSGAVGELKHLEGGLKEYIVNPRKHNFYAVDNIWDKDNEFAGKKCGFFVPESWAYFGKDRDPKSEYFGQPFIDEHGNSFVERAEEYIKKKRLGLVPQNLDEDEDIVAEDDKFDISQKPLTLAECFQYRGENIFPLELLNPQIEKVERRELHGIYVDLYETQSKEIKHKILDKYTNKPILEHPIDPKRKDKEGVIQVWEFPPSNRATYGVYWAGVDIVKDSESINSPSMNVIHIYKGAHNMSEEYKEKIIVAKYMSRPKDKMEWFEKAIMLMEWYNAEALVENNVNWFIEEAIKIKKQHRIAKTPQWVKDMTPQGTSHLTKPYGVVTTPKLIEKILDVVSKYIKEPIYTEYNEETGEPTIHYGIERINDLQLLRELVNYRPKKEYEKGNYDSLYSFALALLQAEYNEVRGIIPKDIKENKNFSQKNAKLMLRSRFSHSNLKKLLNVNNIQ